MSIEVIINYTDECSESGLDKTLKSLSKFKINPDVISICIHPPYRFRSGDRFQRKLKYYFKNKHRWNMHILTKTMKITEVINFAAEKSKEKYYLFVNAGYELKDDIVDNIKESDVFFIDPEDQETYNGFLCNTKLHKYLLGFGNEYSLIYKIEEKLKQMEEAKNAEQST